MVSQLCIFIGSKVMLLLASALLSMSWAGFEPASLGLESICRSRVLPLAHSDHVVPSRHLDTSSNSIPFIIVSEKGDAQTGLELLTFQSAVE